MAEYKILGVSKLADLKPDGSFVYFYRVRFQYRDITDFVDIPEAEYTQENVEKAIMEKIKVHKALIG